MAIKELFYDQRPVALFNPRAAQRIDPRFTYSRPDSAYYVNDQGDYVLAPADSPRYSYNFDTGEFEGLLIEGSSTNLNTYSATTGAVNGVIGSGGVLPTGWSIAQSLPGVPLTVVNSGIERGLNYVDLNFQGTSLGGAYVLRTGGSVTIPTGGQSYTSSIYLKLVSGTLPTSGFNFIFGLAGGSLGTGQLAPNANLKRFDGSSVFLSAGSQIPAILLVINASISVNFTIRIACPQVEQGTYASSPIITSGAAVTRAADSLSINSINIPSTGSIYVDAKALNTAAGSTLISLKNAANQKLNLAIEDRAELFNSPALVYSAQGNIKPTLPFPVPTANRERNIITWGSNNYQYGTSSARFAQSLSIFIPANLNQLTIGRDSVDPTKAFNGYINAVYLYSGEITPTVAEALVRGELDPVNADTFVPSGPPGSLSLVVNTQGAAADGDTVFELPAESVANDNDIVISWGDQTESGLEGAAAELGAPGLTKTYSAAGIYPIFIEGRLENLRFNNSASAADLVQIVRWGTTANGNDVFLSPSTMENAFNGCTQLDFSATAKTSSLPDTSAVTNWNSAFNNCSSISGVFPQFNFSGATNFNSAWNNCSSLTSFTAAGNQTQNVTIISNAWSGCSSLTSFPLINLSSVTNARSAWSGCISLTNFPALNLSSATDLVFAWSSCNSLTSFPAITLGSAVNLAFAWANCSSLTSFPVIDTSTVTTLEAAWTGCSSLTSFPLINTSACTSFNNAWYNNSSLTSFPLLDSSNVTIFNAAWIFCGSLTSFPLIDTSSGTSFSATWYACGGLTSFPLIDTSSGTNFYATWFQCTGLTSFPAVDTSSGTTFYQTWYRCSSLTSFPSLDFNAATGAATDTGLTGFFQTWYLCSSLTTFPANRFDSSTCTRFQQAWTGCALTAQSIENILVSINTANTSSGNLGIDGGTNASRATWSVTAENAYNALIGRGWTITFNP